MEGKWTPGPWEVSEQELSEGITFCIYGANGWMIGHRNGKMDHLIEADAHLIAAAPDLYDAIDPETLEAIADEIQCFEHSARAASLRYLAKQQRAAQARARGEGSKQ